MAGVWDWDEESPKERCGSGKASTERRLKYVSRIWRSVQEVKE